MNRRRTLKLTLQKWFWGVVLLAMVIVAVTILLILGKFPENIDWMTAGLGGANILSYLFGRRDGANGAKK